ncbi:TonB-dependent receptor domain-containing protein [Pedobacter lithocola]|uniref:TonB-dependent receptor domain-containing protein n=1 Tax=Pedobacter lithocola TaxID=1908239 RepID=A0ABV8PDH4_9SPHI
MYRIFLCIAFFAMPFIAFSQKSKTILLKGKVLDLSNSKPLSGVSIQALGTQNFKFSADDGSFELRLKQDGNQSISFSLLGKKPIQQDFNLKSDTTIVIYMETLSLALKEVAVTAGRRKVGSSSVIDKTAIKNTQPTSLADALQLLPGQLALNPDLSSAQQINIRQVPSNTDAARANALGTAVVLDGIPFSNNANLQTNVNILNSSPGALAPFSSVAGRGNDLRQIPADQIESIEVIRGVPSARYGDLTTGAILVNTRAGVFRPQFTTRVNPNLIEQSVGFGTKLKGNQGILSFDGNISYSEEDPRNTLSQYTRINTQFTWSRPWLNQQLFTTNRIAIFSTLDNAKQDPDDLRYQRKIYSSDKGIRLSSSGKLNTANSWFSLLSYDVGFSYTNQKSLVQELITRDLFPVTDATTNVTQVGRYGEAEYLSIVNTSGKPLSLYGRLEGTIFRTTKNTGKNQFSNQMVVGAEYRYDGNNGDGRLFDPTRPPRQNYSMGDRPRSYADIPSLLQISYYAEDRITTNIFNREVNFNAGLRYDNIQPQNPFKGDYGNILAPRLNIAIETIKNLRLKAGYGITAKAPTLSYMYPGDRYFDLVNYNYYATNPAERLVVLTTVVLDTKNEELKSYQSEKFELGLDYDFKGFIGYLTGFSEITTGAFGTDRKVVPLSVAKFGATSFPIGQPPILNPVPLKYDPFFAAVDITSNNRRIKNTGMEFQFDTPPIQQINTSFNFTGAWIQTQSYDDGNVADAARAVFTSVTPKRIPIFRSGFGNKGERFNTSARFITRIPKLRFLVSGLIQTIWKDTNRGLDLSPYAVGYIDQQGSITYLTTEQAMEAQYTDLRRSLSGTVALTNKPPPLWLFNIRVTKEFKSGSGLSFYVNNLLADRGNYFNVNTQAYTTRNQNLFFGAEFTINL